MTYATELIQRYRQALIYLWNMQFWAPEPFRDYATAAQFERIKLPLFLSLVVDRLGSDLKPPTKIFGDAFKVVPPVPRGDRFLGIMVETPGSHGLWKKPASYQKDDLKLTMFDFFDWQELAWRDFRYCLVRIEECVSEPELNGGRGLIEMADVDVLWEPPGILGMPRPRLQQT